MAMLTRFDPFRDLSRLQDEMMRGFEGRLPVASGESVGWTPACDILEDGENVTIRFELADVELGRVRARVTSAVPLDDASVAAIAEKLAASTQKKVLVERVVDPAILGGVVAQVGSLVYDGSVRTQLEDLRKTLKQ